MAQLAVRLCEVVRKVAADPDAGADRHRQWIGGGGSAELGRRLLEPAQRHQVVDRIPVVRRRIVGIHFDGAMIADGRSRQSHSYTPAIHAAVACALAESPAISMARRAADRARGMMSCGARTPYSPIVV